MDSAPSRQELSTHTHHPRHHNAQNADHLAHNSPLSAFFVEAVCTVGTTPVQEAASPPPIGGIALHEDPTRRRHAARGLHVVQNPHHFLHVGRHLTCDTRLPCRDTRQNSPSTPSPPLTRYKTRPATAPLVLNREKTRPAPGILGPTRYKTHPARHKTPIFGHFSRARRILSRPGRQQAEQGELFRAQTAVTWRR